MVIAPCPGAGRSDGSVGLPKTGHGKDEPEGLKLQDQSLVSLADHGFHHRPLAVFNLVESDGNFFQVAILVVGNIAAGCAIAFKTGQLGQVVRPLWTNRLLSWR